VVIEFSGDGLCDASLKENMRVNPAEISLARDFSTGDTCRY